MSRFGDWDYDSGCEDWPNQTAMQSHNIERTLYGQKGQKLLAEILDALLALPRRRLIDGDLVTQEGEVCMLGAVEVYRATQDPSVPREVACQQIWSHYVYADAEGVFPLEDAAFRDAVEARFNAGLPKSRRLPSTLLNVIQEINDRPYDLRDETPEARWIRCVNFCCRYLNIRNPEGVPHARV